MSGDWMIHALWFAFGAACMFVLIVAIAPVMLSSQIGQAQERAQRQASETTQEATDA